MDQSFQNKSNQQEPLRNTAPDIRQHPLTRDQYWTFDEEMKKNIKQQYMNCVDYACENLQALPDRLSSNELISHLILPDETIIPINPLQGTTFLINSPLKVQPLLNLEGVELQLSDKRLFIIDTATNIAPVITKENLSYDVEVGCNVTDSRTFMSFSLNDVYGVSFHVENIVACRSKINRVKNNELILIGSLLVVLSLITFFYLLASEASFLIGLIFIIIGCVLITIGLFPNKTIMEQPTNIYYNNNLIRIITLDPIYKKRASLVIYVHPKYTISEIVQWTRELQNRCPAIYDPKPIYTTMEV